MSDISVDLDQIEAERRRIRETYLRPPQARPPTPAGGVHHLALLSSNVERTVRFYQEVLGGLHHVAISMAPESWHAAKARLDDAAVPYQEESGTSIYFRDPDGARLELIADPLGEMYGSSVR